MDYDVRWNHRRFCSDVDLYMTQKNLWGQVRAHFHQSGLNSLLSALCSFGIDENYSKQALLWVQEFQQNRPLCKDLDAYKLMGFYGFEIPTPGWVLHP